MSGTDPSESKWTKKGPWYAEGLHFTCQRCGRCCTGAPGFVWVNKEEIRRAADFLGMAGRQFRRRFCRRVFGRISLIERPNYDCVFLTPQGCRIYPVRPRQCRTFPFWPAHLTGPASWASLKSACAGVGEGKLYCCEEIEQILEGQRST